MLQHHRHITHKTSTFRFRPSPRLTKYTGPTSSVVRNYMGDSRSVLKFLTTRVQAVLQFLITFKKSCILGKWLIKKEHLGCFYIYWLWNGTKSRRKEQDLNVTSQGSLIQRVQIKSLARKSWLTLSYCFRRAFDPSPAHLKQKHLTRFGEKYVQTLAPDGLAAETEIVN